MAQRRHSVNLLWRHCFGSGCWSQSAGFRSALFIFPISVDSQNLGRQRGFLPLPYPPPAKHTSRNPALPPDSSRSSDPLASLPMPTSSISPTWTISSPPSSPLPVPASPACSPYEAEGPFENLRPSSASCYLYDLGQGPEPLLGHPICKGEGNGNPLQYSCLKYPMD